MAAVLANWGGYYSQRIYLTEARRLGLKLHTPISITRTPSSQSSTPTASHISIIVVKQCRPEGPVM
jgi:hypothetical protein